MQPRNSAISPDMPPIPEVLSMDGPMSLSAPTPASSNPAITPRSGRPGTDPIDHLEARHPVPEIETHIQWEDKKNKRQLKAQRKEERRRRKREAENGGERTSHPDAKPHSHTHRVVRSARRIFIRKPFLKLVLGRRLGSAAKDGLKTLADVEGDPIVTVEIVERSAPSKEGSHVTVVISPGCSAETSVGHQCGDGNVRKCAAAPGGEASSKVGTGAKGKLADS